jgi:hypothetical protein
MEFYAYALTYNPLGSMSYDDQQRRFSPFLLIEWKCDFENAVEMALAHWPDARKAFENVTAELVGDEFTPVTPGELTDLCQRIGPALRHRGLSPGAYFTRVRK